MPTLSAAFRRPIAAYAALALLALVPSLAIADDAIELPNLVVGATRLPTPAGEVATSLSVVTAEDIARKQLRTLPDVLRELPGLNVLQSGGPGTITSVFVRGTNANHTKVLIDGIDVGDPSTADGAFDFAHIATADIERIEVLRGPQSGLYGSDAIGGVVNIVTKKGSGPLKLGGLVEGGSFGTFNEAASASGSLQGLSYAVTAAHARSTSTAVTPIDLLPAGRDRIDDWYDNQTYTLKLGADVTDGIALGLVARYVLTDLLFTGDDFSVFPSVPSAEQSESQSRQLFTRATATQKLGDGVFDHTLGVAYTDYRRRDIAPGTAPTFNRGDRVKIDWQGNVHLGRSHVLTFGAEHQRDEIRDSPVSASQTDDAGFLQLSSGLFGRLFTTASLRYDANDRFGGKATWRVAPALLFPETGTKLKGSAGTGYKAPSLVQLFVDFPAFNFFANPNLKPETSLGWDAGVEQTAFAERATVGASWYHNDIKNLIAANDTFTTDVNKAEATTKGVESFAEWRPADRVTLRADYTFTIAMDDVLHQELLRRPRHKGSLTAGWQPDDATSLAATVLYVGGSVDGNRDFSIPRLQSGGYTLVNLAASRLVGDGVTAFGRIDNLLDRQYQTPIGYQRPGLGVFAGLRIAFDTGPGAR